MRTTEKRFEYFSWYVSAMSGLLTFGGVILDAHRPPAHIWYGLGFGSLMVLLVYVSIQGMGRLILFDPSRPTPGNPRKRHEQSEYIKIWHIQRETINR